MPRIHIPWKRYAYDIGITALACCALFSFAWTCLISGQSMEPTLGDHDYIIQAQHLSLRFVKIERGTLVSVRKTYLKARSKELWSKRIVGMPGEIVWFRHGDLFVNGKLVPEPYLPALNRGNYTCMPVILPPKHYFIIGDNRDHTISSADPDVGPVPLENIDGKLLFRLWPNPGWLQ